MSATCLNACESVTTRLGGVFKLSSAFCNSVSLTTRLKQLESNKSRRTWTCGKIILPLGASLSIGITRMTVLF